MRNIKKNHWYILLYSIAIILSFVPLIFILKNFNGGYSSDLSDWGNWGQYVSGSVGTLLSALTIILVVHSINLQREEFENMMVTQEKTLDLLKTQNIESFFFNLLDLHHRITENTFVIDNGKYIKGRESFNLLINKCHEIWYSKQTTDKKINVTKHLNSQVEGFSHYINNMKQTFNFIDNIKNEDIKNSYISIYKSQLSNSELALLGYLSNLSKIELKTIIKKYSLLENIDMEENIQLPESHKPLIISELINN